MVYVIGDVELERPLTPNGMKIVESEQNDSLYSEVICTDICTPT